MNHPPFGPNYGSITAVDASVIEACLDELLSRRILRVLEIGAFRGETGLGIRNYCATRNCAVAYWGVDAGLITEPGQPPFDGATIIKGRSEEVVDKIPDALDFVFIDGCHCRNHIFLDTLNYAPKVSPGGFIAFHDTSPEIQCTTKQPCGDNAPRFHVDVLKAFEMLRWPWPPFVLFKSDYQPGCDLGGVSAYLHYRP